MTTFRQKISLFVLAIILTCVLLESLLRLGGWIFSLRQDYLNRGIEFAENEYRILCLGESTTALGGENSYPFQLREMLQARRPQQKYVVINKGLVSKTTGDILAQLPVNLSRYRPHLVIMMMGINDRGVFEKEGWFTRRGLPLLRRWRTFHLFELLTEHIQNKFSSGGKKSPDIPAMETSDVEEMLAQESGLTQIFKIMQEVHIAAEQKVQQREKEGKTPELEQEILKLRMMEIWLLAATGKYHRVRGRYQEAEKILRMALGYLPDNGGLLLELAMCYVDQGLYDQALPFLKKATEVEPNLIESWIELGRCYDRLGQDQEVYPILDRIFREAKDNTWVYVEIGSWLLIRGYLEKAEMFFLKALSQNPNDPEISAFLADVYQRQGNTTEAEKFLQAASSRREEASMYLPETIRNYRAIIHLNQTWGAKSIVMQYPIRPLAPLQAIFERPEGLIFVDQETNFKAALKTERYDTIFKDYFGGNFGHCTREGNRLIAERLAEVILTQVLVP